jgi:hypothetical protein
MTAPIRSLIQAGAATLLLGVTFAPNAFASSGDPMSRDLEFRESLARHDDSMESAAPGPVFRLFSRRINPSKKDRAAR